jgi:predicted HicB family RNase H-like nuclease
MPPGKPKIKTAVMTLRVDPRVKVAAEIAADRDHRSVTSFIEVLILNHCKQVGVEVPSRKEVAS